MCNVSHLLCRCIHRVGTASKRLALGNLAHSLLGKHGKVKLGGLLLIEICLLHIVGMLHLHRMHPQHQENLSFLVDSRCKWSVNRHLWLWNRYLFGIRCTCARRLNQSCCSIVPRGRVCSLVGQCHLGIHLFHNWCTTCHWQRLWM